MDTMLIKTHKREALPCYKGFKAYQPLNCWWAEQGVVPHSEFRDGNVLAGYQQLRVLKDCLAATGVTKVAHIGFQGGGRQVGGRILAPVCCDDGCARGLVL
jgi:hypothetical protein